MGAGVKPGSARGVVRADRAKEFPPRADGRDPRAVFARAALADGQSRVSVAAKLGLSRTGLADLIERDDPVRMGPEDACHLIAFHMPPAFGPPARDPAHAAAWAERDAWCDRLEDVATAVTGAARSHCLHLADLHRHHSSFYPGLNIPASDCAAPSVVRAMKEADLYGSRGLQVEI